MNHLRSLKQISKPFSALLILVVVLTLLGYAGPAAMAASSSSSIAVQLADVPIYKNTFEESVDLAAEGIAPPGTSYRSIPQCGLPERFAVTRGQRVPGGGRPFFVEYPILNG